MSINEVSIYRVEYDAYENRVETVLLQ